MKERLWQPPTPGASVCEVREGVQEAASKGREAAAR